MKIKTVILCALSAALIISSGALGTYAQSTCTPKKKCGGSQACPAPVPSPVCSTYTTATACNSAPHGTSYPPNDATLVCVDDPTAKCTDGANSGGSLHCGTGGHFCTFTNGICQDATDEPFPGYLDCLSGS